MASRFTVRLDQTIATVHDTNHTPQSRKSHVPAAANDSTVWLDPPSHTRDRFSPATFVKISSQTQQGQNRPMACHGAVCAGNKVCSYKRFSLSRNVLFPGCKRWLLLCRPRAPQRGFKACSLKPPFRIGNSHAAEGQVLTHRVLTKLVAQNLH